MSTGEVVQIVIAVIMLAGVIAAYLTALLNWRSSPVLLATKEKHSKDLMELLEDWRNEIITQGLPTYNPPTGEEQRFSIEQHILFDDLKNHVPRELGISELWGKFRFIRNELDKKIVDYYDHTKVYLERYSRLNVLNYKEESKGPTIGITHQCLDWFYSNLLRKAEEKGMSLELRLSIPDHAPSELRKDGGNIWAWTNSQTETQQIMSLIQEMVANINSGRSDTAEWSLFLEAEGVVSARNELQGQRDMIVNRIDEIKAIPILTGNCKHIERAREPLFGYRRSWSGENMHDLGFSRKDLLMHGIIFFFFSVSLIIYSGGPLQVPYFIGTYTAPQSVSEILNKTVMIPVTVIVGLISLLCLVGVFRPTVTNRFVPFLGKHRKWIVPIYGSFFFMAYTLNFFISWIPKLGSVADEQWLFFVIYVIGLIWCVGIIVTLSREGKAK